MRIGLLFDHFGPYHLARLRAAKGVADVHAIEFHGRSADYGWTGGVQNRLEIATLEAGPGGATGWKQPFRKKLREELAALAPDVLALPGWSAFESLCALEWCAEKGVPAVVMSESCRHDETRRWWSEQIKQRVLKHFSAGLVGGSLHRSYLTELGLPVDKIFLGYDAVDNHYFSSAAAALRVHAEPGGNQRRCFLASARFIEKKNLPRLLTAYAAYREFVKQGGREEPWRLLLLGDGPMRAELVRHVATLELSESVQMPGFRAYEELPTYYAQAGAFIHASTTEQWGLVVNEAMASALPVLVANRCGSAPDLVKEGVNGHTFDPFDAEGMAQCMLRMSSLSHGARGQMGQAGQDIIQQWGPERFARGLLAAAEAAVSAPRPKTGLLDGGVLKLLCRR